jgi:uncharacterized protein YfiM (DUF2279 family)
MSGITIKKNLLLLLFTLLAASSVFGQTNGTDKDTIAPPIFLTDSNTTAQSFNDTLNPGEKRTRQWIVGGIHVVGYGTSMVLFNNAWYKNYPKTSFHTFDDSGEWQQMDKVGHSWGAYNIARASAAMWRWSGVSHKTSTWIGGLSSTAYLTVIEILDGHSAGWGWSWADMGANLFGSGLFISQELGWKEQRLQFKFSFHKNNYSEFELDKRAEQLFGDTWYEKMLKDYNAQTYWLSANLRSFFPNSKLPAWLNVSVGYGSEGMFGGFKNQWIDVLGSDVVRNDIPRVRQFYFAPDIDFTKIRTKSKFLKTTFAILNAFKCPAPALMLDSEGNFRAYALYF